MRRLHAKDFEGKWVVLFFYPKDFTFVCPTEIIAFSDHVKEFKQRGAEVIGASCDSAEVRSPSFGHTTVGLRRRAAQSRCPEHMKCCVLR